MSSVAKKSITFFYVLIGLFIMTSCGGGSEIDSSSSEFFEDEPVITLQDRRFVKGSLQTTSSSLSLIKTAKTKLIECVADQIVAVDAAGNATIGAIDGDCNFQIELEIGKSYIFSFTKDGKYIATIVFDELSSPLLTISQDSDPLNLGSISIVGNTAILADEAATICLMDGDGDGISICDDDDEIYEVTASSDGTSKPGNNGDCTGTNQVSICHDPQGENQTVCTDITTGDFVVHFEHGDQLGECEALSASDEECPEGYAPSIKNGNCRQIDCDGCIILSLAITVDGDPDEITVSGPKDAPKNVTINSDGIFVIDNPPVNQMIVTVAGSAEEICYVHTSCSDPLVPDQRWDACVIEEVNPNDSIDVNWDGSRLHLYPEDYRDYCVDEPEPEPLCGDNTLNDGEECDDGNNIDGDGCQADCQLPVCGDAIVDVGESCDDGNNIDSDGCAADCSAEFCGDGFVNNGEACDDGGTDDGDGCSALCVVEICGDGLINNGEECDDGNNSDGDGCSSTCSVEIVVEEYCGDGIVQAGEECDGGENNSDTSDASCRTNCTTSKCGDNIIDVGMGEDCDDGNQIDSDGCNSDCQMPDCGNGLLDQGEACDDGNNVNGDGTCQSNCELPVCGDNILDPSEQCDDGNTNDGDGCDSSCQNEPYCGDGNVDDGEQCDAGDNNSDTADAPCRTDCTNPICGDQIVDIGMGEDCDDGNLLENDGCNSDCQLPDCGNGILDQGEVCDDGNNVDGDGTCQANCQLPACGDGIIDDDLGEECDDGDLIDGNGCNSDCQLPECGNGILDQGEACEDGNNVDGDGCNAVCVVEFCGDGIQQAGEECDDGNDSDADSCSNKCQITYCGDGFVNAGEQCDDGNGSDADSCSNKCQITYCGDGILNAGEQCDLGSINGEDFIPCTLQCTIPGDDTGQ